VGKGARLGGRSIVRTVPALLVGSPPACIMHVALRHRQAGRRPTTAARAGVDRMRQDRRQWRSSPKLLGGADLSSMVAQGRRHTSICS
jgi:hypothetical protein